MTAWSAKIKLRSAATFKKIFSLLKFDLTRLSRAVGFRRGRLLGWSAFGAVGFRGGRQRESGLH